MSHFNVSLKRIFAIWSVITVFTFKWFLSCMLSYMSLHEIYPMRVKFTQKTCVVIVKIISCHNRTRFAMLNYFFTIHLVQFPKTTSTCYIIWKRLFHKKIKYNQKYVITFMISKFIAKCMIISKQLENPVFNDVS